MNQGFLAAVRQLTAGLHFRFLSLVVGVAAVMLAAQLASDTVTELRNERERRLADALEVTNVIARSLEKQFDIIELDDIEQILASVRQRSDIRHLTVVDAHKTFFLDGDIMTSPIIAVDASPVQDQALNSAKTAFNVSGNVIEVAEPLLAGGKLRQEKIGLGAGLGSRLDKNRINGLGSSFDSMGGARAIGSVTIAFNNPGLWETLGPIIWSKLFTVLPILLGGLWFAAHLVSQITAPIKQLVQTAQAISEGDLERQARPAGAHEIRRLAHVFNQMVDTIRENIAQIYDLAYVDKITRLPNREFFRRELSQAVARVKRNGRSGALLFVDLDGFKRVNDTFGHDFGDKLLAEFAERISEVVRHGDHISLDAAKSLYEDEANVAEPSKQGNTFARLGGDEFTILLPETRSETDAATVAIRIINAVEKPFAIDGKEVTVGTSIGIGTFPRDGEDYQTILKHADMAMYQAKEEGKNTYRFFSPELNVQASNRMTIETDLRKALAEGELELYYQPKIDTELDCAYGLEGLIRWHHPERGMVNPGEFISIAEDCGLIVPLGNYVIETACRQLAAFAKQGIYLPVAVNISMQQFDKENFADLVREILDRTGADPRLLELEITESMAMSSPEIVLRHIGQLKKLGVRFAIDDFGTGYSNLAQLSQLPFDVFKIDRSFVNKLAGDDDHGEAIVRTIIAMAHSLDYETVAEGVETQEQLDALKRHGCRVMQGFLFARPMPVAILQEWLTGKVETSVQPKRAGGSKAA